MMNYRIDKLVAAEDRVVLRVSGRIHGDALNSLRELLSQERGTLAIDLKEVSIVDRETVIFLSLSETRGIELWNCPPFVREWIDREK